MMKWWILVIVGSFVLMSCENELQDVQQMFDYPDPEIDWVKNPRITFSDSARIKARVRAPLLHRKQTVGGEYVDKFVEGVKVEFLDENQRVKSWLFADYGENRRNKNEIFVRDRVLMYNVEGDTLRSEELYWDVDKSILRTEKFVRLESEGQLFYGFGFKAKDDFSEWEMKALKGVADLPDN